MFVRPETNRTAFAEEAGTTVLAVGSRVGQPYEVGGWEVWAEFHPAYEAGEYDAVIDRARETLEASGYATPLYNLACCEALTGRNEDAIGHLRVAIERRPSLRDLAKEDTDLDPIRDEPAFHELRRPSCPAHGRCERAWSAAGLQASCGAAAVVVAKESSQARARVGRLRPARGVGPLSASGCG